LSIEDVLKQLQRLQWEIYEAIKPGVVTAEALRETTEALKQAADAARTAAEQLARLRLSRRLRWVGIGTPEVTKYPTVYEIVGVAWTTPENILGPPDGLCAYNSRAGSKDNEYIKVSGFGFELPPGSVIDKVYVGSHGIGYNDFVTCGPPYYATYIAKHWYLPRAAASYTEPCYCSDVSVGCGDSISHEMLLIEAVKPTAEELNLEQFEFKLFNRSGYPLGNNGWFDAAWIRVIYTLPPPQIGYTYGNGLVLVKIGS